MKALLKTCREQRSGNEFQAPNTSALGSSEPVDSVHALRQAQERVRQAPACCRAGRHHERNQRVTVRLEPVEGLNQSFLGGYREGCAIDSEMTCDDNNEFASNELD